VKTREVKVHFEQEGPELTAVEIGQTGRSPLIVSLHRALFALGVVVSSYQVRPGAHGGLIERVVIARRDGGAVQGQLGERARSVILPIALSPDTEVQSA
jgi:hypothetical protein